MEGDRTAGRLNEVGIVGAGLAGTTLAIALKHAGLDVRLYDRSEQPAEGQPLTLTANGTRVLHAIGLKEILQDIALFPDFAVVRHARTAFMLSQRPLGQFSEARYGAPDCVLMSGRLIGALRQEAAHQHVPLDAGTSIEDVDAGTATLRLADGTEHRHNALAVACGLPREPDQPGLSNLLNVRTWQPDAGFRVLQVIGSRAEPARDHDRFLTTWLADGLVILEQPLPSDSDAQRLALTLVVPGTLNGEDPAEAMERLLARAHPYLRNLFDTFEAAWITGPSSAPAEYWFAEKLALLGGACHAHASFPDIAPSAVLEDAWVLSRMMERWEDEPHQGFADYERFRKPRAARLRAFSEAERASLMLAEPMRTWRRNLGWSLTSRFLPEIALQKTDWLYGYDCIRGFA